MAAEEFSYRRMCEASAAEALDATHFVVASDESNTLLIFKRGHAEPLHGHGLDLEEFLDADKSDLEGAAIVGSRIYWITSHSLNSGGQVKKKRFRFFATDILEEPDGPHLVAAGEPYKKLRDDLIDSEKLGPYDLATAAALPPKTEGAFDIEGLTAKPDGTLLIGFRSPVRNNKALVVPLENPAKVVGGKDPDIGDPIDLDLGGRGIRSIERIGGEYLIVAGSWGDERNFALFRWSGEGDEDPIELTENGLGDLNAEALFALAETGNVQILSDDGKVAIDGRRCENEPAQKQSFRSIDMTVE
jgi:hypothetical protein